MKYLTPTQFAARHGISAERVRQFLRWGRIVGAVKLESGAYIIPSTSRNPALPGTGYRLKKGKK